MSYTGQGNTTLRLVDASEVGIAKYNFDSAIPGTGAERILGNQIPLDSEYFSIVFWPNLDWKSFKGDIEKFYGAIAGSCKNLILMHLRPSKIIDSVLCIVPLPRT